MADFEQQADIMYGNPTDDVEEAQDGTLAGGHQAAPDNADEQPSDPADVLYNNPEDGSIGDRYYASLMNDGVVHDFVDALDGTGATDYTEFHQELSEGLHDLGVSDNQASQILRHISNSETRPISEEEALQNDQEVRDWLRTNEEASSDLLLAGSLLAERFGDSGVLIAQKIEEHATPELLQQVRDMVQSFKRNVHNGG